MASMHPVLNQIHDRVTVVSRSVHPIHPATIFAVLVLSVALCTTRWKGRSTSLRGPPRTSVLYGLSRVLLESQDDGLIHEAWVMEYGGAYEVPAPLGQKRIFLSDPKAIAYFYAKDAKIYAHPTATRSFILRNIGRGLLWSQSECHRRQRRSLNPAFSHVSIRELTPFLYHSAHKVKAAWETIIGLDGGDSTAIEVQNWMNHISLDIIGLAAFSHNFGSLDGEADSVIKVLDSAPERGILNVAPFLLVDVFPVLVWIPTARNKLFKELEQSMAHIFEALLKKTKEKAADALHRDNSMIELLVKDINSKHQHSYGEILAQMKTIMLAGYETTSITMTWALIELARNPSIQATLREELLAFGAEPPYDQLPYDLPYLDAVVHEALRLHPPFTNIIRQATEDDVIPLSKPVHTKSGEVVDSICVSRGTSVGVSIACMNRSNAIWGPDAKEFRPARWLERETMPKKVQGMPGYRHLQSFADGPRVCLGRWLALAELRIVLLVLVKHFVFELRDGPDTKVEKGWGLLPRPKIAGEVGTGVPLCVRRFGE